ncbi:hypothetical protein FS837_002380 [Tulasnella sp. UAMH 9824]|nr:hypothetical protein FS837_002380 [Tulasnella sp. UAMH 9824]
MASDDMSAVKRPRLGYLNSAGLRTAESVTQSWSLLSAPHSSRLPVELITIILTLRFPNDHRSTTETREIYGLRLVSHAWKELIEHTPWLWTYISAYYPTTVIQDCLRLSRNHLLRVEILSGRNWLFDDGPKHLNEKLQLLRPHAERWEELNYDTQEGSSADNQLVSDFLESPAPNLQSIVAILPHTMPYPPPTLNLAGGKTNQLKHLRLGNVSLPWSSQLLTRLETFSLEIKGTVPVEEMVNIFIKNPGLKSFHLSCYKEGLGIPDLPTSDGSNTFEATANSLEEINIGFNDLGIANHILSRVYMPACRSIKLAVKPLGRMDDFLSLNVALSQFAPKIGQAMNEGGRTTFYDWPKQPLKWSVSSQQEVFQLSIEFSYLSLEDVIWCIRDLASASASELELEVYLGPTSQRDADELGRWYGITKLHISSPFKFDCDRNDDAVLFPDYLGHTRTDLEPELSWSFPDLQELDISELECSYLRVFDMLNQRYLSDSDTQRMKDLRIHINTPSKLGIVVRDSLKWEDSLIVPAIESHRGVKSLEYASPEI